MANSLQDIIDQMAEAGITGLSTDDLIADGRYHRFRPEEEHKRKKSGWYILFSHVTKSGREVYNGAFGKGADTYKLRASAGDFSTEEREEIQRARKAAEKAAAKLRETEAQAAARKAQALWGRAHEEGAHPYLDAKGVRPFGLRFLRDMLLVPARDVSGVLAGCQYVLPDGSKRFNTGMDKSGRFHVLGDLASAEVILFGEGYATCASAHTATRWPCVTCFDAGNIDPVMAALRPLYPNARFVILGDDDRHLRRRLRERLVTLDVPGKVDPDGVEHVFHRVDGELRVRAWFEDWHGGKRIGFSVQRGQAAKREWFLENAGRVKATLAAKKFQAIAVFPCFAADEADGTDFNDLQQAEGLGVVRSQILNAIAAHDEAIKRAADGRRSDKRASAGTSHGAGLGGDWTDRLLYRKGELAGCLANIIEILTNDPAWTGVLAFNEFSLRIEKRKDLPIGTTEAGIWSDSDDVATVLWLTHKYGMTPKPADVSQAAEYVSRQHPYHPVRDWLRRQKWDGVRRTDEWLHRFLGTDLNDYTRRVSRWFLIGMVARVMQPGVKFDYCLVLEGAQGKGKSTALAVLGGEWYSDQELDLRNKDAMASLPGVFLQEFSELGALTRHEAHQQKSFLSRTHDRFRPVYGRHIQNVPRQTAFSGSTNDWEWNKDPTGGRRFWPVEVGEIDIPGLRAVREQLFAEALHLYEAGQRFAPSQQEQREIFDPEQLKRESQDSLVDTLAEWVSKQPHNAPFSKAAAMMDGLKLDPSKMTRDMDTRVGIALKKLGCRRVEKRLDQVCRYWYYPPERPGYTDTTVNDVSGTAHPPVEEDDYVAF
ncbi:MAG TPA: VapE family protein [Rhodocyclaceae bacterium]|nr:VapE family protein [Rhodocyclaceae bacterium]